MIDYDCDYEAPLMPYSLYVYIEEKVVELFIKLNITKFPIKPTRIAKALNIKTKPYKKLDDKIKNYLLSKEIYGVGLYDNKKGCYCIYYDGGPTNARSRFTLMHEIGHYVLGHKEESDLAEKMADYFAGYALAPMPIMSLCNCFCIQTVIKTFNISKACAEVCYSRRLNWDKYSKYLKPHEEKLLRQFNLPIKKIDYNYIDDDIF